MKRGIWKENGNVRMTTSKVDAFVNQTTRSDPIRIRMCGKRLENRESEAGLSPMELDVRIRALAWMTSERIR
jgi:hypothetical protein